MFQHHIVHATSSVAMCCTPDTAISEAVSRRESTSANDQHHHSQKKKHRHHDNSMKSASIASLHADGDHHHHHRHNSTVTALLDIRTLAQRLSLRHKSTSGSRQKTAQSPPLTPQSTVDQTIAQRSNSYPMVVTRRAKAAFGGTHSATYDVADASGFLNLHASDLVFSSNSHARLNANAVLIVQQSASGTATCTLFKLDAATNVHQIYMLRDVDEQLLKLENATVGFNDLSLVTLALIVFGQHLYNARLIIVTDRIDGQDAGGLSMPFDDYAKSLNCQYHIQPRDTTTDCENGKPNQPHMLQRLMFCETAPNVVAPSTIQLMRLRMMLSGTWLTRWCSCYT